ncbi:MAG: MJ1477/TM1410 family putative glycoside hydrolase [Hyphomicrobiaceae bacterium]
MSVSMTLLWIAIAVLLIVVALLAWRLWQTSRTPVQSRPEGDSGRLAPHASDTPPPVARQRSSAPPPASAGGTAGSGGQAPARQSAPAASDSYPTSRPRTSKPPPALAGHIPGISPSSSSAASHARSRSGTRPPPASAGGARGDDEASDPEPARRRSAGVPIPQSSPARALAGAASWGYQLQEIELQAIEHAPFDLVVIDYSRDGSEEEAFTPSELARLKRRGGARQRLVYAYVSVGEAESYRYYWQRRWKSTPPGWLIGENPEWHENFYVRFWDPDWQRILFGAKDSYIDRIAAAGFDGIYLDRCDVHEEIAERHPQVARERADIEGDMVEFVTALSGWVRQTHSGLGIIMQNAEGLLRHTSVRDAIDASAKEELLFGLSRAEKRNTRDEVLEARRMLDLMRRDGKAVFAVEYLAKPELQLEAAGALRAIGYIPYIAREDRELASLETRQPEPAVA